MCAACLISAAGTVLAEDLAPNSFYEKYLAPGAAEALREEGIGTLLDLEGLNRQSRVHLWCFALRRGRRWPESSRFQDMLKRGIWTERALDEAGAAITLTADEEAILAAWPEKHRQEFRRLAAFIIGGMRFYCDDNAEPNARSWIVPYYADIPEIEPPDTAGFLSSLPTELIAEIRKEAKSLKDPRVWLKKSSQLLKKQGHKTSKPSISYGLMPTLEYHLRIHSYLRLRFGDRLKECLDAYEQRREEAAHPAPATDDEAATRIPIPEPVRRGAVAEAKAFRAARDQDIDTCRKHILEAEREYRGFVDNNPNHVFAGNVTNEAKTRI
jgi:hypothetical protein